MAAAMDSIVITGVGMATSLGGAVQGAAAARARIARPSPLADILVFDEDLGENAQPMGHVVRGITDGFVGLGRLVRLGLAAVQDLFGASTSSPPLPSQTALILGVPDSYILRKASVAESGGNANELKRQAAEIQEDQHALSRALAAAISKFTGLMLNVVDSEVPYEGAAVIGALSEAMRMLSAGTTECCLVGAIDSLADPVRLEAAHALHLVHTTEAPTGFIPGEAAAFVMLETRRGAKRRGVAPQATLGEPILAREPADDLSNEAPSGRVLARVITQSNVIVAKAGRVASFMLGSLNGSDWRAREWGAAVTQLHHSLSNLSLSLSAVSLGELGTAFPIVAAVLATRAHVRGYAGGSAVLVWASGEDGCKGAFHIGAPQPT